MQTSEAVAKRKSARKFDPTKAVPGEIIDVVAKAGFQALEKSTESCAKMGMPDGFEPVSAAAIGDSLSCDAQPRNLSVSLNTDYI